MDERLLLPEFLEHPSGGRRRYPAPLQDEYGFDEPPSWEEAGDDDGWVAEAMTWHPAEEWFERYEDDYDWDDDPYDWDDEEDRS